MSLVCYDLGHGRTVFRHARDPRPSKRADIACPLLIRDAFDAPVQSMANGRWYESKRALSASHKASGNPHGQDFIELGHEDVKWKEHKSDERQLRDDIQASMVDIAEGRLPEIVSLTSD